MGERKGTNKYYPPDYDPKKGGLNKFLGTHALRERARKIHMGIIIVRFEMPYNIWCDGCNNHIGMGVRYNAEKTKIGMYYTTPVYQFRMKCHLCDNHFEIKTDPGNLDYVIVTGARRQENRWDPTQNEQVVPETKETQKKLFDDAMYKLEHGEEDKATASDAKPRLAKLYNRNEMTWNDDFAANQKLRNIFRKKRKEIKLSHETDEALLKKSCLSITLVPERDEDKKLASLLLLKPSSDLVENSMKKINKIIESPALPNSPSASLVQEKKANRLLGIRPLNSSSLGIVPKRKSDQSNDTNSQLTNSATLPKLVCDYGSSTSNSDTD